MVHTIEPVSGEVNAESADMEPTSYGLNPRERPDTITLRAMDERGPQCGRG